MEIEIDIERDRLAGERERKWKQATLAGRGRRKLQGNEMEKRRSLA
jgi:hypothetical protein